MKQAQIEIEQIKDAAEELEALQEFGIVGEAAVEMLNRIHEIMTAANQLGRLIVQTAAPEHEAHSEAYIWAQIHSILEDNHSGNLRELIGDIDIEIPLED